VGGRFPEVPSAQFPPPPVIIEGKSDQRFSYLSGGVSSDEREVMEERGKIFNLKLVFAEKTGDYLANVSLTIRDAKGGKVISINTDGPRFYAQLPSASCSIAATFNGRTKKIGSLNMVDGKFVRQVLL